MMSTAAVGVGMCWPWETAATLPSARRRKALRRPRGRRGAGAYRGGRPPTACFTLQVELSFQERLLFTFATFLCVFLLNVFTNAVDLKRYQYGRHQC